MNFKKIFLEDLKRGHLLSLQDLQDKFAFQYQINNTEEEVPNPLKQKIKTWYDQVFHLSSLKNFIVAPNVNEIIWHNSQDIQVDSDGSLDWHRLEEISQEDFFTSLETLALRFQQDWNLKEAFKSFYIHLYDCKMRATLIHSTLSPKKTPKLFLRKVLNKNLHFTDFSIESLMQEKIIQWIQEKKNIIISGSTGSGKTSFINLLLEQTSDSEHVLILEDTHELSHQKKNFSHLLSDDQMPGRGLDDYCQYCLRMRPDRMVLGEIRAKEIVPLFLNLNTGHNGLLTTVHANSAKDTLHRLTLLFILYAPTKQFDYPTTLKLLAQNIDYIIYLENKKVMQIVKVLGAEKNFPFIEEVLL